MTKAEMISTIQKKEKELSEKLNRFEDEHGINGEATRLLRMQWSGIYGLMLELGINTI